LLDALVGTIDRDALNRAAFAGAAKPTPGLFPAPLGLTVPSVPPPSPTPGAKREAEFSLLIPCDDAVRRQEADTLSAEWSAVGARVAISCRAPVDLYGASGLLPAGRFEMALYAYPWPADPSGWAPFGTSGGSQNWSHCSDPAIDSAFAAGMATLDARKRREAYLAGARAWLAYHCSVPLFDRPEAVERAARLHNFVANPVAGAETWNAADWWLSS
jgi:ABC-type transport system substrate-binding protein